LWLELRRRLPRSGGHLRCSGLFHGRRPLWPHGLPSSQRLLWACRLLKWLLRLGGTRRLALRRESLGIRFSAERFKSSGLKLPLLKKGQPLHFSQVHTAQIHALERGEEGLPVRRGETDGGGHGGRGCQGCGRARRRSWEGRTGLEARPTPRFRTEHKSVILLGGVRDCIKQRLDLRSLWSLGPGALRNG